MATVKLVINLSQGLIEAEGEQEFVLRIYNDFKDRLNAARKYSNESGSLDQAEVAFDTNLPSKRGSKTRRKSPPKLSGEKTSGSSGGGISRYEPKRDPDLDLSMLPEYVGQYDLKGNPERYLVYAHFLKDKLSIVPCSVDHLYSCFLEMKDDLPGRMGQNLIDTRLRNAFVKFTTPHDITITTTGINHFNKKLTKKVVE